MCCALIDVPWHQLAFRSLGKGVNDAATAQGRQRKANNDGGGDFTWNNESATFTEIIQTLFEWFSLAMRTKDLVAPVDLLSLQVQPLCDDRKSQPLSLNPSYHTGKWSFLL